MRWDWQKETSPSPSCLLALCSTRGKHPACHSGTRLMPVKKWKEKALHWGGKEALGPHQSQSGNSSPQVTGRAKSWILRDSGNVVAVGENRSSPRGAAKCFPQDPTVMIVSCSELVCSVLENVRTSTYFTCLSQLWFQLLVTFHFRHLGWHFPGQASALACYKKKRRKKGKQPKKKDQYKFMDFDRFQSARRKRGYFVHAKKNQHLQLVNWEFAV